jgi:PAS domain S-box-containing protein
MSLIETERIYPFFDLLVMVGIAGADGHFRRLNPAWETTLGWTRDELISKPYLSLVHPDDREATAALLAEGAKTINLVNRYLCRDGSYKWLEWSLALDEAGEMYFIARDISAAIGIQQELAEKAALSVRVQRELAEKATIVDLAHDAIIVKNSLDGRIRYWNRGAETMYGYTSAEAVGQDGGELLKTASPVGLHEMMATAANSEHWDGHLTQTTKGGEQLTVEARWAVLPDGNSSAGQTIEINRDITARLLAEAALQDAYDSLDLKVRERTAELESFSYSVSHDLRTPLRAVNGFVEVLIEEMPDQLNEAAKDALNEIHSNAIRMGQLIDDLLAFSRLGQQELQRRPVDMRSLAVRSRDGLASITEGRSIELDIQPIPMCDGDPALLEIVWTNLLANAIKFTAGRQPAQITVGAEERDGRVVYFVRDNGVGFEMAHSAKLFGVFERLHAADEFEGTGVGLATVKRICNRHGGKVWAEAVLGRGATFYFTVRGGKR